MPCASKDGMTMNSSGDFSLRDSAGSQVLEGALVRALWPLQFRGKGRLLKALVGQRGERKTRLFGYSTDLDLSDHIQRAMYFGTMEPPETKWVSNWLCPGMTVVDVGANAGYYTLLSARSVGSTGRVLAFEPGPSLCARLRKTIATNNISHVSLMQMALGSSPGQATLYMSAKSYHCNTPSLLDAWADGESTSVEIRTLDNCLDDGDVQIVDLLKIDVEGYEVQVLRGASEALRAGRIRAVLCEVNPWWLEKAGSTPKELFNLLESFGFKDSGDARAEADNRIFILSRPAGN